jgi:hypothetical protein
VFDLIMEVRTGMTVDAERNRTTATKRVEGAGEPVRLRALGWVLFGVSAALSVASMAVPALIDHPLTNDRGEIQVYLDVFEEGNLPTWWSTGLLVMGALLYVVVGVTGRTAGVRGAWTWFVGAGVLGALSLDDHTALHERLDRIGKDIVSFDGFPFYWLLPGLVAGAAVLAAVLILARRLRGMARWCLIDGCGLLLFSAMGMEALQGVLIATGESGPLYVLTYHAEELGENIGVLLMLAAAFRSLSIQRQAGNLTLRYQG